MPDSGITLISEPIISESIRNWVEIVAIIAAGIWAVWVFVYKRTIVPSRLPPHLVISTNLQEAGRKNVISTNLQRVEREDSLVAIRAEVLVTNKSKTRVEVFASWFNASAVNISYTGDEKDEKKEADTSFARTVITELKKSPDVTSTLRHIQEDRVETVAAGRLLAETMWFDPNEEVSRRIVFYVSDQFDVVEFRATIQYDKSRKKFDQEWTTAELGSIKSERYIKLRGFKKDPKKRELYDPEKKKHKKIKKRFGVAVVRYVGRISLWG